jgi:cytoskeletal protein CcmA (bactofilin family)
MASNVSVVGRATRIRGRVTGAADLEVQGFVEGEIAVSGDVTVDTQGMVGAGIRGRRLVVRGAVKGDLVGQESVSLEEGARVVGDVRAPRVSIAPGALLRGFIETGDEAVAPARAARTQPVARPAPAPVSAAMPARPAAPPAAAVAPKAAPQASASGGGSSAAIAAAAARAPAAAKPAAALEASSNHSGGAGHFARRPPPPVVPALKRAKGQIAKRRER